MRALLWPVAGAVSIGLLAATRVEVSQDVDTWAVGPLPGQIVHALEGVDGGLLVATRNGLHRLEATGVLRDLGVPGPVTALSSGGAGTWVGTGDGVLRLAPGAAPHPDGLTDVGVHALDAREATVVAGTDSGVHRRGPSGTWERLWPAEGEDPTRVEAVLATAHGVLFDHPRGLGLAGSDGTADVVLEGVDVVALGSWAGAGLVWVGTRGAPLLLVSDDEGLTWRERGDGLGFHAVHALVAAPGDPERAVVGGSGLADGTGNAGTQRTDDLGGTWQVRQDRLSNTHVFALEARDEPLRLHVRLAGTELGGALALPVDGPRWYAGTNGSGLATHRPDLPALTTLAGITPVLRLAEPLVAGTLLLACVLPAYRYLTGGSQRSPPGGRSHRPRHRVPAHARQPHPRRNR